MHAQACQPTRCLSASLSDACAAVGLLRPLIGCRLLLPAAPGLTRTPSLPSPQTPPPPKQTELLTGKGALAQLGYEVGLPTFEVDWLIGGLIALNLAGALLPTSGTFVPEENGQADRPDGPLQNPKISIFTPKQFFGVSSFGFTKANELFVGRMAQLGFVASLLGEIYSGKGPLAQFGFETGIPLQDTEFGLAVGIVFMLLAAVNEGTGKFVDE